MFRYSNCLSNDLNTFPFTLQNTIHNSDTEADRQIPRRRAAVSSIVARRNWRKALDDIKKARQSGIYSSVSDQTEEESARERVKSILQGDPDKPKKKIRPKSDGDAVSVSSILKIRFNLSKKTLL